MADKSVVEGGEDVNVPISPLIPFGNDNVWADVSSLLRLACDDLRNDELICGESFNLFAAMSALEFVEEFGPRNKVRVEDVCSLFGFKERHLSETYEICVRN